MLSIRPKYVTRILAGEKSVEFRRRLPRQAPIGSKLAIYATAPVGGLVAMAKIESYIESGPQNVWRSCRGKGGISCSEFNSYFKDSELAVGIFLASVQPVTPIVTLRDLRDWWPGFHPPQQFAYFDDQEVALLLNRNSRDSMKRFSNSPSMNKFLPNCG